MVFISVGAVAWDYFTGWRAWSVTYVLADHVYGGNAGAGSCEPRAEG